MNFQAVLFILFLGSMFGTATVASRFSVGQFNPVTYSALRFSLAALVYSAVYIFRLAGKRWPKDRQLWKHTAITGLLGSALPATLIVSSLKYLSSGLTATMVTLFPVTTVIMAHFLLPDEPLTRRKISGVLLSLSGAFLIVALGETGLSDIAQVNPVGYIMIFAAALFQGFSAIYIRKNMVIYPAFEVTSLRLLFAALFVLPAAYLLEGFDLSRVNGAGVAAYLVGSLVILVGFFLGFYGIKRFGVSITAMVDYIPPVVASIGGAWLLDEKITPGMLAGMGLILTGVVIINLKRNSPSSRQVGSVHQENP